MRGTIGYIAPEVFCRTFGDVSYKSEANQMMVLEEVGKKRELKSKAQVICTFPNTYKELENEEPEVGINMIGMDEDDNQLKRKIIAVSLWCIQPVPSSRPSMSRVVQMLEESPDSIEAGMEDSKLVSTPLSATTAVLINYLGLTCADVGYSVNKLFPFMQHPTSEHWTTLKCLLWYLASTSHLGILVFVDPVPYEDQDDYVSTIGYILYFGSALISGAPRNQKHYPHNILLDEQFCPKILDFGLVKLTSEDKQSKISMSGMRGTIGYNALEFLELLAMSLKNQMSGMMVLEVIGSRKKASNQVNLWCIQPVPTSRPSMSRVMQMLEVLSQLRFNSTYASASIPLPGYNGILLHHLQ
ncbi:LOW QUALITY PROTEIN: hypothetical protein V2J09_006103 [Rumex salicifolius]